MCTQERRLQACCHGHELLQKRKFHKNEILELPVQKKKKKKKLGEDGRARSVNFREMISFPRWSGKGIMKATHQSSHP